jgi:hypothetical protein
MEVEYYAYNIAKVMCNSGRIMDLVDKAARE